MGQPTPPDMQAILQQAQEMQAQLQQAQKEILATELTGTAGGGLVEVTITGGGEMTGVKIDPKVVDPEDIETLQDLIVGAFLDAHRQAGLLAEQKMGPVSQGLNGDLGSLFG